MLAYKKGAGAPEGAPAINGLEWIGKLSGQAAVGEDVLHGDPANAGAAPHFAAVRLLLVDLQPGVDHDVAYQGAADTGVRTDPGGVEAAGHGAGSAGAGDAEAGVGQVGRLRTFRFLVLTKPTAMASEGTVVRMVLPERLPLATVELVPVLVLALRST